MILRRFMKHVSDQNWFAVGLDVLVVITGIFLGLQVSEWNEDRKKEQQERDYIERLVTEMDVSILSNSAQLVLGLTGLKGIAKAHAMLRSGDLGDHNRLEFEEAFQNSDIFASIQPVDTVLSEMVASGRVELISNPSLRAAITAYDAQINRIRISDKGHFELFLGIRKSFHQQLSLPIDYDAGELLIATSNEDIKNNNTLTGDLSFMHEFMGVQLGILENFINNSKDLHAKLQKYQKEMQ